MVDKMKVKVAASQWVPWTSVAREANDTIISVSGPMGNLLDILADKLNIECEMVYPPDGLWGVRDSEGNWNGMMGMLHRQEVEMALGPFGMSHDRAQVCDFSVPVYSEKVTIITERPRLLNDLSGFLKPFTPTVWALLVLSVVLVCFAYALLYRQEGELRGRTPRNVLSEAMLWVVRTLTQESSEYLPQTDGSRMVVATWLMASLVFMSSYSGILTAMLTVPRVNTPIDSLQDLVSQRDMPWRLEIGGVMFQYFQDATEGIRKAVFDGRAGVYKDCWTDREDLRRGHFAGICDVTAMKKVMSWDFSATGECHLYMARESIYQIPLSLAFKTNSTYMKKADYWIRRVKKAGLFNKWIQLETRNSSQCLLPLSATMPGNTVSGLSLGSFFGCLLLLGVGLTVALSVYLGEVYMAWLLRP